MSGDAERVTRAARSVGLYVAVASAIIITAGVGILIAVIVSTSRWEGAEHGDSPIGGETGGRSFDDLVVDLDRVVPTVIVLGVIGVVLLGIVAWFAARRSVRPLAAALQAQRNFVADASHELRTPLTTLSSRIQLLQRRRDRGEAIDETIAELRRDAAMMSDVLTDLLLAAEGETGTAAAEVSDSITAAVAALRALAEDGGVALVVQSTSGSRVGLPAVTLTRVLLALIDNAIQHSPAGASVTISDHEDGSHVSIHVSDTGSGITGIDAARVFERFARSSESGRRRGFGLGLSLVRDVAVRAGGSVEVEQTSSHGTTFLLRLPLAG